MSIITRKDFECMDVSFGRDLWNKSKLAYIVFNQHPSAVSFTYNMTTGLWTTVLYKDQNNQIHEARVYDGDEYRIRRLIK